MWSAHNKTQHENSACCTGNHNAHWEGKFVLGGEVKCSKEMKDVVNITWVLYKVKKNFLNFLKYMWRVKTARYSGMQC